MLYDFFGVHNIFSLYMISISFLNQERFLLISIYMKFRYFSKYNLKNLKINDRTLSNVTYNSAFQSNSTVVSESDALTFLFNDAALEKERLGIQSFDLLQLIGKGSFGEVFLVEKKTSHELYALKVLSKDKIISKL